MRTLIKFCGITNWDDARMAVELGADAVGFVFYRQSPRYILPQDAVRIIERLPAFVMPVGIFVDEPPSRVRDDCRRSGVRLAQLHGDESPLVCTATGLPWIKAFRVRGRDDLERITEYDIRNGFLLDSFVDGVHGGTGRTFDWELAVEARRLGPMVLAGGLNPENAGEAVRRVRPFGLDVSSGVEKSPGVKDHARMRDFVRAVRTADDAD